MKLPSTRKYHYRGIDTGKESRRLWLMIIIGLVLAALVIFLL